MDYNDTENNMNEQPVAHEQMLCEVNRICDTYDFVFVTSLGMTDNGLVLPIITLGEGERAVLYSGTDEGSTGILLRFIEEYCMAYRRGGVTYGCSLPYLYTQRMICIVPSLPSGAYSSGIIQNYMCFNDSIRFYLELSTGNPGIYCDTDNSIRRQAITRQIKKMSGIKNTYPAPEAGNIRYCTDSCGKPAAGISSASFGDNGFFVSYFSVRESLFRLPLLI